MPKTSALELMPELAASIRAVVLPAIMNDVSVGELAAQTGIPHPKNSTAPTSAGMFAELDRYRL
jgi:hypothetical protein